MSGIVSFAGSTACSRSRCLVLRDVCETQIKFVFFAADVSAGTVPLADKDLPRSSGKHRKSSKIETNCAPEARN